MHGIEFGLSVMSAVRSLSYDQRAQRLVSAPLPAYTSLRNATLASEAQPLRLSSRQHSTPAFPRNTGHAYPSARLSFDGTPLYLY